MALDAPNRRAPAKKRKPARKPAAKRAPASRGPQGLPGPRKPVITKGTVQARRRQQRQNPFNKPSVRKGGTVKVGVGVHKKGKINKRSAPEKVLGSIRKQVTKEFEGRGELAKALGTVAKHVHIRPGGVPTVDERLGINKSTAAKVPGRIVKDLINFPAQAVPAVYVPVAGAVEAARGNPKRLKGLVHDLDKHDPFVNLGAAGLAALQGHNKVATKRLKAAKKAAEAHPGFTILEGAGVKGSAGRGAGATMRSGALGKGAKRAASTKRPPRTVEGTGLVHEREYSRDVLKKASQVAREKSKRDETKSLRETAARIEERNPDRAAEMRQKANRIDPDRMSAREIRRRVDERADANENIRREHRGRTIHHVEKIVKQANRSERKALSLVTQNITTPEFRDLRAYLDELEQQVPNLDRAGRVANKALQRQIKNVLSGKLDPERVRRVASEYEKLTTPLQKGLVERGLLDKAQADRSPLIPYAVRKMGARFDPETDALTLHGKVLSSDAIRTHMKEHGVPEPAFLTQAPNTRGGRNFNVRSEQPQQIRTARRTGESTRKGTFDADVQTLTENAARSQGLIDAVDGFRSFVGEFSVRGGSGKPRTFENKRQVDRVVNNLNARDSGTEFTAIRVSPFGARRELIDQLMDQPDAHQIKGFRDLIDEALAGEEGSGPWAIIPKAAADQLRAHLRSMGPGGTAKAWQAFNSQFRQTVLSTSPSWLAGNVVEGATRTAIAHAGPRSYVTGRRVLAELRKIDPKAAEEATARTVAGGHFSFAKRAHVHRDATQFQDTAYEGLATALGKVRRTPGPKHVANAWNWYTNAVFNHLNGRLEQQFQTAMLGKAIRDSPLMDGQTLKLSQKAVEQAAKGLRGTNEQVALGRAVDRMYGKYGKFSPGERMAIAYYTPFVAWTLNAARFVVDVMPRDHPVTTALIASAENATEEWRKDHGLDMFMQGAVPGWLQGTIPLSGGRKLPAARYTPFGAFGDPTGTAAGAVLPQVSGILAAFKGEDWKGNPLRKDNGQPADVLDKLKAAGQAVVESTVPIVAVAGRVKEKGPKALNPFNPIEPSSGSAGASSGGKPDPETQKLLREAGGDQAVDQDEIDKLLREVGG